jgi:hypothetical protein
VVKLAASRTDDIVGTRRGEQDIVAAREQYERVDAPGSAELQKAVRHEVAACDAIWQGEWAPALELIRQVLDALLSLRSDRAARAVRRPALRSGG